MLEHAGKVPARRPRRLIRATRGRNGATNGQGASTSRKPQRHARPARRATYFHPSAQRVHHPPHHRQPHARAGRPGRGERLADAGQRLGRKPGRRLRPPARITAARSNADHVAVSPLDCTALRSTFVTASWRDRVDHHQSCRRRRARSLGRALVAVEQQPGGGPRFASGCSAGGERAAAQLQQLIHQLIEPAGLFGDDLEQVSGGPAAAWSATAPGRCRWRRPGCAPRETSPPRPHPARRAVRARPARAAAEGWQRMAHQPANSSMAVPAAGSANCRSPSARQGPRPTNSGACTMRDAGRSEDLFAQRLGNDSRTVGARRR